MQCGTRVGGLFSEQACGFTLQVLSTKFHPSVPYGNNIIGLTVPYSNILLILSYRTATYYWACQGLPQARMSDAYSFAPKDKTLTQAYEA